MVKGQLIRLSINLCKQEDREAYSKVFQAGHKDLDIIRAGMKSLLRRKPEVAIRGDLSHG